MIRNELNTSNIKAFDYFGARYYDSDISVWLSVDPLSDMYPSTSPFMYVGGNPVMLIVPDGMKWGKPGDKAQQKSDKAQANKLKASYVSKRDAFKKTSDNLGDKIDNYSGDKSSQEYKDMQSQRSEANEGYTSMQAGINGINDMESNENYFTFNAVDGGEITPTSVENSEGTQTITLNYASAKYTGSQSKSDANKAHEAHHGAQIARGNMYFSKGTLYSLKKFAPFREYMPYKIQYFYDKSSMPISIKSSKELRNIGAYLKKINNKAGYERYKGN